MWSNLYSFKNITQCYLTQILNGSTFYAAIGNILYKGQFSQLTNCSLACLLLKYWLFISTYKADILHALVTIKKLEILALQCWTAVQTEPIVVTASIITWINDNRSCCGCNSDGLDWHFTGVFEWVCVRMWFWVGHRSRSGGLRERDNWLGQAWHLVCPWARRAQRGKVSHSIPGIRIVTDSF